MSEQCFSGKWVQEGSVMRNFHIGTSCNFCTDTFIISIYYEIILKRWREKKESCGERLMKRRIREFLWTKALFVV